MSNPKSEADSTTPRTAQSASAPLPIAQRPAAPIETSRQDSVASRPHDARASSSHEIATLTAPKPGSTRTKTHAETSSPSYRRVETRPPSRTSATISNKEELLRRQESARALFEKYNVPFETVSWEIQPKLVAERVSRPTRIRVRWTCHECKTTFGNDPTCVECAHHRCRNCIRFPPKRNKTKAAKATALAADRSNHSNEEGQEGRCHECQATFAIGSLECSNCHHRICDRCLQEILSSDKQVQTPAV